MSLWYQDRFGHTLILYPKMELRGLYPFTTSVNTRIQYTTLHPSEWGWVYIGELD